MPAIGMALLWGGYTLGMWGYCSLMGYKITLRELVKPGAYSGKWPPETYPAAAQQPTPQVPPGSHPGDAPYSYEPPNGGIV